MQIIWVDRYSIGAIHRFRNLFIRRTTVSVELAARVVSGIFEVCGFLLFSSASSINSSHSIATAFTPIMASNTASCTHTIFPKIRDTAAAATARDANACLQVHDDATERPRRGIRRFPTTAIAIRSRRILKSTNFNSSAVTSLVVDISVTIHLLTRGCTAVSPAIADPTPSTPSANAPNHVCKLPLLVAHT